VFELRLPTKIIFGRNTADQVGTEAREYGNKALLVTGRSAMRKAGVVDKVICSESGQIAIPGRCPEPIKEIFQEQLAPTESCSIHKTRNPFKKFLEGVKDLVNNL